MTQTTCSKTLLALTLGVVTCIAAYAQPRAEGDRPRRGAGMKLKIPQVGDEVEEFELKDVEGETVKLSGLRGKILALELGACT